MRVSYDVQTAGGLTVVIQMKAAKAAKLASQFFAETQGGRLSAISNAGMADPTPF